MTNKDSEEKSNLRRDLGVFGATMMGLGSIVGTGVFVSIGIAAGVAGPAVVLAIVLAALLAICNALSSAQLAANHPVSGGTYEYGYEFLNPTLGFTAGWMFLCAKSASAATAALGFAGYLVHVLGFPESNLQSVIAVAAVGLLTVVVLAGIRRANWANVLIVSITLGSLILFVLAGLPTVFESGTERLLPLFEAEADVEFSQSLRSLLSATALMFVAYTGYGRIATLGEEVRDPRTTIPKAIVTTLVVSATLYVVVSVVAVSALGAAGLATATESNSAPLEVAAGQLRWQNVRWVVAVGAITAMLGVLLNLILGLSRVLLAMGRRRDMPAIFGVVDKRSSTPVTAVIAVGVLIATLASIGSVKTTWSFSAFTVLIYYSITNLSALRLPKSARLYSPVFPWTGLSGCLFLAFWVEWKVWLCGLVLIVCGLVWHWLARKKSKPSA